ncbi:universal stress protein [Catelliglobosispora koreensis]|uniref:universal stress protein n=1 Tax=Catelliglobosispora koreensis TaxID=129052 RepID=UPI000375685D|nr:universal stress protein [Catelliglobosispora koreensis]
MDAYEIVVGVDGSAGSRRGLEWAVLEAATRGGVVKAITAWHPVENGVSTPAELQRNAQELVEAEAAAHAREGVTITAEAVEGRPAQVLAKAACDANLLVIGSHGASRAWHQLVGSTAEEIIRLAQCPVVVVPVPHDQRT